MFYILYHKNRILGVYDNLDLVESEISSLVYNNLIDFNDVKVVNYEKNINSLGKNVNFVLKRPSNSQINICNLSNVTNQRSNIVTDNDLFEDLSENETTSDDLEYDSETENSDNDDNNNEEPKEPKEPKEKTKEQLEKEERRRDRQNKLDYNIQLLKNKKENLREAERVFNVDLDLFTKFKKIKNETPDFVIPPMFEKKYDTMLILEENNELNFKTFYSVFEKDTTNTKWNRLFSGNAKDRPLLEITESESEGGDEEDN